MTYETFVAINEISKERLPDACHGMRVKSECYSDDDINMGYVCDYRGQELFLTIPQMLTMIYQKGIHLTNPSTLKPNSGWEKETRKALAVHVPDEVFTCSNPNHPYINNYMRNYMNHFTIWDNNQFLMMIPDQKMWNLMGKSEEEKKKGVKTIISELNKLLVRQQRSAFSTDEQKIIEEKLTQWLQER